MSKEESKYTSMSSDEQSEPKSELHSFEGIYVSKDKIFLKIYILGAMHQSNMIGWVVIDKQKAKKLEAELHKWLSE